MIARFGRRGRTFCVTALAVFATSTPSNPSGVVAQVSTNLPWWSELTIPEVLRGSVIETLHNEPASTFDPALPSISLEQWLSVSFLPVVEQVPRELVEWLVTFCPDRQSPRPALGPEICAEGTMRLSAERMVHIVIAAAQAERNATTGGPEWRRTPPALRDLWVERLTGSEPGDSLDVPALSALPRMINTPFEQWPAADFETKVSWDPRVPAPGDTVRFSISVRNRSARNVDRVHIVIAIGQREAKEVRQEWYPRMPAGETIRVDGSVPLPDGTAMATVYVTPVQERHKKVREVDAGPAAAIVLIGHPDGYPLPPTRPTSRPGQ